MTINPTASLEFFYFVSRTSSKHSNFYQYSNISYEIYNRNCMNQITLNCT